MALLYFRVSHRSRANTDSSAARQAQYIQREGIYAGRESITGEQAQYIQREGRESAREDLVAKGGRLPAWAHGDHTEFWSAAEQYERLNGRISTNWIITLPRELTQEQNVALAKAFIAHSLETPGYPHTWGIHGGIAQDGSPQPHLHAMISHRMMDGIERSAAQFFSRYNSAHPEEGGARKDPEQNASNAVGVARQVYSDFVNVALEQWGHAARVDPRSLEERGFVGRKKEIHIGPVGADGMQKMQEKLLERREERAKHQAQELEQAQRYWEFRKRELGLHQGMTPEAVAQRIGDASRGQIAQAQAVRREYSGMSEAVVVQRYQQTTERLAQTRSVRDAEAHFIRHPEQLRTVAHRVEVAAVLQDDTDRHRSRVRRRGGEDEGDERRRGVGYER